MLEVPHRDMFAGEDYLPAEAVEARAQELIARHEGLAFIEGWRVMYLWRAKGGKRNGKLKLGTCQLASGLTGYLAQADWIICLAADHCRQLELTDEQLEALVFHELLHCAVEEGKDDELRPTVRGHDWEGFRSEVEQYGCWKPDIAAMAGTFQQVELPLGWTPNTPPSAATKKAAQRLGKRLRDSGFEKVTLTTNVAGEARTIEVPLRERLKADPDTGEILE